MIVRTTLTLDPDVAAMLERLQRQEKSGLKDLVNRALRQSLPDLLEPRPKTRRFRTEPVSLGRCLVPSLDDVAAVLAAAEGEDFR